MEIKVIRSWRRYKTVSARLINDILEIRTPALLPKEKINYFTKIFERKIRKRKKVKTNTFLKKRANILYKKYLGKNVEKFTICWSEKQRKIFGICHYKKKIIRISSRLKKVPLWVLDYVLIHELAHLFYPHHQKKFWQTVNQYPRAERAKGFLLGMDFVL